MTVADFAERFSLAEYAARTVTPPMAGDQYWTMFPWRLSYDALDAFAKVRPSPFVAGAPMVTGPTPNPGEPMSAPV